MNLFFKLTVFLLRVLFLTLYRIRVYGTDMVYPGGAIIAPNHASYFDPPIISMAWPEETHYLARASLFDSAFLRFLLTRLHTHPVHGSAQDIASFKVICQLLNEGKKVVIFPEGKRTEDGNLQSIKTGVAMLALRTQSFIIPVYIVGTYDVWPKHNRWPKPWGKVACVFGNPIFIEPYLSLDKKSAQLAITERLDESIKGLKNWYASGAKGPIP